jgi:hypothetical protein
MPKAKTTSKKKVEENGAGYRLSGFLIIVLFASLGLVWLWLQMPKRSEQPVTRPPVQQPAEPAPSANPQKAACDAARGKWVDCGNPCHGKPGEACIKMCEPQCLCGGIAGFACPKDLVCTDYEPSAGTPDAMGVCRAKLSEPAPQPEPTTPVRERPTGMTCDDRNFICVDPSFASQPLTSPFVVEGTGIAFENTINWRLLDGNGGVLQQGFVTADAPDIGKAGPFEIRPFLLQVPTTSTGTLEVLEYSAKDGSPTHVVKIPVRLPTLSMKTKFFMPSGSTTDCSEMSPVELDVTRSALPVETALRTLLAVGPSMSSKRSAIPPDTRLVSLKVANGTATVVLSYELGNYGGGSCNVAAIRAQIEQTLKQFSSVRNVVISQEGKTPEESLQP